MEVDDLDETTIVCDLNLVSFLRYFMMKRLLEDTEAIAIYKSIFKSDINGAYFEDKIKTLNEMLDSSKLSVQKCTCEVTSKTCFVLVSTQYNPDAIMPSNFNDAQLEYVKNVLHELIVSEYGVISVMKCVNLETKLSKSAAESLVKKLIADKWLVEPRKGRVALSALATTELTPYFQTNYKAVLENCAFCKRVFYYGELCSNCKAKGHPLCVEKYAKSLTKKFKCPSCHKEWGTTQPNTQDITELEDMEC